MKQSIRRVAGAVVLAGAAVPAAALAQGSAPPAFSGADTAWMLISTVLVLLMTMPGIILFYSGMLRTKNALSIVAHTVAAAAVITLTWAIVGYSLAFTSGSEWLGGLNRSFSEGLIGKYVGAHPAAPTVPESVFFLFQLSFAIITFALVLGATAERMRLGVTMIFAALWSVFVYAPVAHWVWHPTGWLAKMGHMDFAGGTVVHIASGISGLVAAWVLGPRRGFGREPMIPHNLLITVLGAGLLWAGWFGFNAGSAFEASSRAAGALLATQVAACAGAMLWGACEFMRRGQWSVLGSMTGAIAGLIAVTPASGFVGVNGALAIGATAYAGVPLTYPGAGDALVMIRGFEAPSGTLPDIDWDAIVKLEGTLVCAKCYLKRADAHECQDVLLVQAASGAKLEYYVKKNDVAKQAGEVCTTQVKARITGTVSEKDKDGKTWVVPSKIEKLPADAGSRAGA